MVKFIKENYEEFLVGFLLGLGFFMYVKWYALLLGIASGILWKLGGMGLWGTKAWRRLGIPSLISIFLRVNLLCMSVAFILTLVLLLLGYGQRTIENGIETDSGSPLGNFWRDLVGEKWGKWLSRATIVISIWLVWFVASVWS